MENIYKNIKYLCGYKGITIKQLEMDLGMKEGSITTNARYNPVKLRAIAEYFDIDDKTLRSTLFCTPIYNYKFDKETGAVTRRVIDEYASEDLWYGKVYTKCKCRGKKFTTEQVVADEMDQFKSQRVNSFNPDTEHALQIIRNYYQDRIDGLKAQIQEYEKIIDKLHFVDDTAHDKKGF